MVVLCMIPVSYAANIKVEKISIPVTVDEANIGLFNSPISTYKNAIYIAYVEKIKNKQYSTSVGKLDESGKWVFSVVEPASMNNPYHAQPSLAVDKDGFIHVAYNMHSSPWQYSVSKEPENILEWTFKGQDLNGPHNDKQSAVVAGIGTASIPGNRITYQYMTTDRNGELYISYREALKNEQEVKYGEKQWSLGISKYDVIAKKWNRVGPKGFNLPFATEPGFRPQVAHMSFDYNNNMHVSWNWYVEYDLDGANKKNVISYACSKDGGLSFETASGESLSLPVRRQPSDKIIETDYYQSYTSVGATFDGSPLVSIMPKPPSVKNRSIIAFTKNKGWGKPIDLPYGATHFYINNNNVITAVSSGIRIHRSYNNGKVWEFKEIDINDGPYTIWLDNSYINTTNNLRFLAQSSKTNKLYIYTVEFN